MLIRPIAAAEIADPEPLLDVKSIPFSDLSHDLDMSEVDLVIAPLIGTGFDACELIAHLGRARFRGRLRVIAKRLPDRDLVLRELQALADPLGIRVQLNDIP